MTTKEFGARVKKRRLELGLSQVELAEKIGYKDKSSVAKIESGDRDLPRSKIIEIATALSVTPQYLLGWNEGAKGVPADLAGVKNIHSLPETYTVPRLGAIACGEPIFSPENFEGTDEVPVTLPGVSFTLTCRGDSMKDARIMNGDIVYIREQPMVENGQIAAVMIDNEATLKRFYRHGDTVSLVPANPAYEPFVFQKEEINRLRILGLAIGFVSEIK